LESLIKLLKKFHQTIKKVSSKQSFYFIFNEKRLIKNKNLPIFYFYFLI